MDYRDFSKDGKPPAGKPMDEVSPRWWEKKGKEQADAISSALTIIDHAQMVRMTQLMASARQYGNTALFGVSGSSTAARYGAVQAVLKDRLHYNMTQSLVDTAIARLTRDKPTPFHLTSGGSFHTQRKAKKLNELRDGIFYENQTHRKGEFAARDAAIWGDGLIKVFPRGGRVCHERVPSTQIYVDEMEALTADPRSMHQVVNIDRDVLHDWQDGGKNTKAITDAVRAPMSESRNPSTADVVMLRESWHLPSGPDADDGRHVVSIAGETLQSESWRHPHFPFAKFPWCPKQFGYWAQGGVEQVQPLQLHLNKLLHSLQISYERAVMMIWLIENGSKVVKAHINNQIGVQVTYTGTKPECVTPAIAPPEVYQEIETIIRRGREQFGLSEMAIQGTHPEGVDSGKALRTLDDIETVRFTQISHAYEQFYMDIDRLSIACARDIAEEDGDYEVQVPGKRAMQTRKWSEIDLEPDDYSIHVYPVSSLPDDPAGRMATIQEGVQAGLIPQELAMDLMDFPDLKKFESLQSAMRDRIHEVLDDIVDDGEYEPPEPYFDLQSADQLALQYIVLGESQGLEPERVELLRRWRSQVGVMLQAAQQAAQQQALQAQAAQTMASQPPADPQATPQSQLVPNVNTPGATA